MNRVGLAQGTDVQTKRVEAFHADVTQRERRAPASHGSTMAHVEATARSAEDVDIPLRPEFSTFARTSAGYAPETLAVQPVAQQDHIAPRRSQSVPLRRHASRVDLPRYSHADAVGAVQGDRWKACLYIGRLPKECYPRHGTETLRSARRGTNRSIYTGHQTLQSSVATHLTRRVFIA